MTGHIVLYQPINTLKPIAKDISFQRMPFSTRMTIVRLGNGDLFVHSPTPLPSALREAVNKLFRVAHLVSPNFIHYWWIQEWENQYPDAITWASPKIRPRAAKHDIWRGRVETCFLNVAPSPSPTTAAWNSSLCFRDGN